MTLESAAAGGEDTHAQEAKLQAAREKLSSWRTREAAMEAQRLAEEAELIRDYGAAKQLQAAKGGGPDTAAHEGCACLGGDSSDVRRQIFELLTKTAVLAPEHREFGMLLKELVAQHLQKQPKPPRLGCDDRGVISGGRGQHRRLGYEPACRR